MFDYDWFHGPAFEHQQDEAIWRCASRRFPDIAPDKLQDHPKFQEFREKLEVRKLIYLRDGFSYELKSLAEMDSKNHLTFECEPVDEHYKVGSFVVSVPFEDILRVEVFAVPEDEKPEDMPLITGFQHRPDVTQPMPPRDGAKQH
jgi:hypothetical protein